MGWEPQPSLLSDIQKRIVETLIWHKPQRLTSNSNQYRCVMRPESFTQSGFVLLIIGFILFAAGAGLLAQQILCNTSFRKRTPISHHAPAPTVRSTPDCRRRYFHRGWTHDPAPTPYRTLRRPNPCSTYQSVRKVRAPSRPVSWILPQLREPVAKMKMAGPCYDDECSCGSTSGTGVTTSLLNPAILDFTEFSICVTTS